MTYIFHREHNKLIAAICAIVALTYIVSRIKLHYVGELPSDLTHDFIRGLRDRILLTLLFIDVCFSVMLALLLEVFRQKSKRQSIESEKSKAELALYKSQINPHFMFNTLNTIYALNFTKSAKTGEIIMKFSNIVKYMYQNSLEEKIMITEEVKYLHEFIDLHSLRLNEQTEVNFVSEIDDSSQYIPSMIFITFVENVFKYGVSSSEECSIDISIKLKNKQLSFSTINTIFSRGDNSSGIGIENCRKRLTLLYPDSYTLECTEKDNKYHTLLKIDL